VDWDDPPEQATEDDEENARPHHDLAGTLLAANGFLTLAFGVLLMLTPVGNEQRVDAPDFGALESTGIAALGAAMIVASIWRRERKVTGVVVGVAGLLGAVAILAVLDVALMAVCPTLALLALINRPLPAPEVQ